MPSRLTSRGPISIANSSGAINDGLDQLYRLASEGHVDAITADYLAEFNIAWRAMEILDHPELGYERGFLDQLEYKNAAQLVSEKGIKIVHDGGALNPKGLAMETEKLLHRKGITNMTVAWVTGDNIMPELDHLIEERSAKFEHLDIRGSQLPYKKSQIVSANAYIGMQGIISALKAGADIVICGRCCDASPVMALASWWHDWREDQYDELAGSLIAGHLIECGPYVTGGNFSGFQDIPKLYRVGFPIAEIADDGHCTITKHNGTNGAVTIDTVKAQLVYEIQGSYYLNPDVTAKVDQAQVLALGPDRIEIRGILGSPPPSTNKVAFFLHGGYQAEICAFAVGLDIPGKIALQKKQVLEELDPSEFTTICIEAYGTASKDPQNQREATVAIRHFVQAPTLGAIENFKKALFMSGLQGYPGLHFHMDWRTLEPKSYVTYYPATLDQTALRVVAHVPGLAPIPVQPPKVTKKFTGQESYDTLVTTDMAVFGETVRQPLGDICYARSGDKGGNANVGIWVRDECQWTWLQSFLTIARFKALLGEEYKGFVVERFELPHLFAVHFVTYGILQNGVSSSSMIDGLAKSFGEFLRARVVDIPKKFLYPSAS